jgi:hypothetical protein
MLLLLPSLQCCSRPTAQNKRPLAESTIIKLHAINLIIELCVPIYVVWHYTGSPMFGFQYLFTATVLWVSASMLWYYSVRLHASKSC